MHASLKISLAIAAGALITSSAALAQQDDASLLPPGQKLDRKPPAEIMQAVMMPGTHSIGSAVISPDGSRVAYVSRGKHGARVEIVEIHGMGGGKTISAGAADKDCDTTVPMWSPDGEHFAVTSDCAGDGKQEQIFAGKGDGSALKQVGSLKGYIDAPRFTPDSRGISLLYMENATGPAGATSVQRQPEGVISPTSGQDLQRLAVMPLDSGKVKFISPTALHVYEYDMVKDGASAVYTAAVPPGENNWWVAKLYSQKLDGGEPQVVFDPGTTKTEMHGLQMNVPVASPDGRNAAFIGGLMSDFGPIGGDVWVVPMSGGDAHNLTRGARYTSQGIHWMDAATVGFTSLQRGSMSFNTVPAGGGEVKTLFTYAGSFATNPSIAKNGDTAIVRSSITDPPELWAGPWGSLQQLTHLNTDAKIVGGKTESFTWKSGGYDVQGFVTYPSPYDPAKKYPMIVSIHGGPAASVGNRWSGGRSLGAIYSLAGYFVFEPNDRGSYGQGEAFTQANRKDFGYGDLRDAIAGVDSLEKRLPIDDKHIGITGGSYGGFMSMFAPTQTNRFAASVALAGISDWLSYYGENSIDQWMIPFFGASVYDDPAVYQKQSPITFIKKEKTPMLIIVGDHDGECPPPQSFEMWHALRDLGVPTELVIYPNEGHGLSNPQHLLDSVARSLDWFAKYMPAQ